MMLSETVTLSTYPSIAVPVAVFVASIVILADLAPPGTIPESESAPQSRASG